MPRKYATTAIVDDGEYISTNAISGVGFANIVLQSKMFGERARTAM